ncbi:unnamed protein product [Acanthoscelides obtectus]|uniref:Uncharacterized protein n=1 Tax=Acanthoscelides obtectus TaxID=200917 RepID=A0A9P0VS63_ACAOB|nr:unnamed protein product [Acanthoscelides obtectus]CAK1629805.1 hypothetical protein AOBTE_LOCUS5966 [Acanthoscelides obtectus]
MNSLPLHNIGQYYRKRKYQDEAARSLALVQEYPYRTDYSLNTKSWRRRALWRPSSQPYGQARHERKRRNNNSTTIIRQQQGSPKKPGSKRRRRKS